MAKREWKSPRCTETWDVPWPGHGMAVLEHKRCRKRTTHSSGKCYYHRPSALPAHPSASP